MEKSGLVRKGAWTGEEDQLLRTFIENYGEGKWHQIPEIAGLNRCRKSCRLRWLNYLKPNIKRGEFSADEVDMIVRLHKLLGNRWSLISGRLLGRTSNDVKNYWNTHLKKKTATSGNERGVSETLDNTTPKMVTRRTIFKPRPRTFLKPSIDDHTVSSIDTQKKLSTAETTSSQDNSLSRWWKDLLVSAKSDEGGIFSEEVAQEVQTNINDGEVTPGLDQNKKEATPGPKNLWEHGTDFSFDVDLWSLLDTEDATVAR